MAYLIKSLPLLFMLVWTVFSSNNWEDFQAHELYPAYDTSSCVFPFNYNGQTYYNCTTDGMNGERPWCSLTTDYIGQITLCYDFWQSTYQCDLPFSVNTKWYDSCAYLSRVSMFKECKTDNSKVPSPYRTCIEQHLSHSGRPLYSYDKCDPVYRTISPYHSKCFGPSDFAIPQQLSATAKQAMINVHNQLRRTAGASNMMMLYWDDELADMAQTKANMCALEHDKAANRLIPTYMWYNGQNIHGSVGYRDLPANSFNGMLTYERQFFTYGGTNKDASHYTQAMLADMTRIGCAQTLCVYPDITINYVFCNYEMSQYTDTVQRPFKQGAACGDCPNKCNNGLCDCGNKICNRNAGERLNPNTCVCETASG